MRITCSCCCVGDAVVLCCVDHAVFCLQCDKKIHVSKASSNHQRVLLSFRSPLARWPKCDGCQENIGIFFCSEHRTLVCRDCDLLLHTPNSPAATHGRFLVTGARIGEVGVPNSAPVNRGTSSSQSTVCSSISPAGYQYHTDYKGKRGKTVSNKSAGNKRILGWDRTSSPIPTNSYPVNRYVPVPNKRCAGTSSPIPTNQNPDHVNQSSSPMLSMSLVLEPKFVPTPGLPSNLPSLATTSHSNPRDQQMETNTPVNPLTTNISNTVLDMGEVANPIFQPDDFLNLAGGDNSNLNHSYDYPNSQKYSNQNYPYNYPNNQQYSNPIYSYNHPNNQQNNDPPAGGSGTDMVSNLLNDDYGLMSADNKVRDDSDWWSSVFQTAGELLNSEAEIDDADWPASRQLERALMHQEFLACTMPSFPSTSTQPRQE